MVGRNRPRDSSASIGAATAAALSVSIPTPSAALSVSILPPSAALPVSILPPSAAATRATTTSAPTTSTEG